MKSLLICLLLLSLLLLGCQQSARVEIEDKAVVLVEVADDARERSQGLMYRESLGEDSGMLFLFEEEGTRSFWMKNTLIPLDIIYIDSSFEIVDIQTALPCGHDPCPHYASKAPAQFVLEVNAGFAEEKGIAEGDKVSFHLS